MHTTPHRGSRAMSIRAGADCVMATQPARSGRCGRLRCGCNIALTARRQAGQAYAEMIVGFCVIGLFLYGGHHLWLYAEAQQLAVEAVRFAAWERVAWEPSDNSVEKHALHKSDANLAVSTVMHQLSTPSALRAYRAGITASGGTTAYSNTDRRSWLKSAMKSFVTFGEDPDDMISLSTSSGWMNAVEHWYRGRDPTFNTTTSLELDQDTYRTVTLSFKSQLTGESSLLRYFDFPMSSIDMTRKLSLITNAWAASPPMMRIRTARQLLPFSTGDSVSGTEANVLAYFGLSNSSSSTSAADFIGMAPWWNFLGGQNGMGGQYVVHQIGLSASSANSLLQSAGTSFSKNFTSADPAGSLLLRAQLAQSEAFSPIAVSNAQHRHTTIWDETADSKTAVPRNSKLGRRKYRAASLQNPVETYFAE